MVAMRESQSRSCRVEVAEWKLQSGCCEVKVAGWRLHRESCTERVKEMEPRWGAAVGS